MKSATSKKKNGFLDELAAMLPKERVERARKQAKKEIYQIQLLNVDSIETPETFPLRFTLPKR